MATYQPSAQQLRQLVLDYLLHNSYVDTAQVFAAESADVVKPPALSRNGSESDGRHTPMDMETDTDEDTDEDMDTDEDGSSVSGSRTSSVERTDVDVSEEALSQVRIRREIRHHILSGRVQTATDLLNAHFPAVLREAEPESESSSANSASSLIYIYRSPPSELRPRAVPPPAIVAMAMDRKRNRALASRSGRASGYTAVPAASCDTPHARVGYASTVSTKPVHIALNLRVLAFIEAARTVPLAYSDDPESHADSLNAAPIAAAGVGANGNSASAVATVSTSAAASSSTSASASASTSSDAFSMHQTELLHRAQRLYAAVESLRDLRDRDVYREELKQVGGLLAYPAPERSPMARYMRQERREAVADQVNSAILYHLGKPATSYIELFARQTAATWSAMLDCDVELPPPAQHPVKLPFTAVLVPDDKVATQPALSSGKGERVKMECRIPLFDLKEFLETP